MNKNKKLVNFLITGGSGFIGSCLIRRLLKTTNAKIFNIDKCGYASDTFLLDKFVEKNNYKSRYELFNLDLYNKEELNLAFQKINPDFVMHLAAESHVDRSIDNPSEFIKSNIMGTFNLLEASRSFWKDLPSTRKSKFRFHHISTDEVFGSLPDSKGNEKFDELSSYDPRSPYSASKASSDFLVRSWFHTYKFPAIITNCSNNFGPRQFPEKLIPMVIQKILDKDIIPVYGNGSNIRDWLFVEDHIDALLLALQKGIPGETYCVGGYGELSNIELIYIICEILQIRKPSADLSYKDLIKFVDDRPGHDQKYSINSQKITSKLGWKPKYDLYEALQITVDWYLENLEWCNLMKKKSGYFSERLGIIKD